MSGTAPQDPVEPVETEAPDETSPAEVESGDVAENPTSTTDEPHVDPPGEAAEEEPRFDVEHGEEKSEDEAEEEDSSLGES